MRILAVDGGSSLSGYVLFRNGDPPTRMGKVPNLELVQILQEEKFDILAIEVPKPRGGKMWWQLIEMAVWVGRFIQASGKPFHPVDRRDVKIHVGKSGKAKDGDIRAAIIERFGGKDKAIGTKKNPGPLFNMKADMWQAYAVGLTYLEGGCKSIYDL